MKAKLVNENTNLIFKPKSKEEIDLINERLKQQTNEFMTKIFSDLHKDPNEPNVYKNSKGDWIFVLDFKKDIIHVRFDLILKYFYDNIIISFNIVKRLIESWLRENTNWPQLPINPMTDYYYKFFIKVNTN